MSIETTEFFSRLATIPTIGVKGVERLESSSVAVVGVGGVGSAAAYYLAKCGIGTLRLIDQDIVDPTNLQRLHGVGSDDLFHPKAEAMSRRLCELNESCRIEPVVDTLTDRNSRELLGDIDLVIDGLDNFRTRYILNGFAVETRSPYLFISAVSQQSHLAMLNSPSTACLECVFPRVTDRFEDSCESLGVSPIVTGLAGTVGAGAAIQFLLGGQTGLLNHLMTIDMAGPEFLTNELSKRQDCEVCGSLRKTAVKTLPTVSSLCGEHTANVLPPDDLNLELSRISMNIHPEDKLLSTNSVLVFRHGQFTISLFRSGRLLINGVVDEMQASQIAEEIWSLIREDSCAESV